MPKGENVAAWFTEICHEQALLGWLRWGNTRKRAKVGEWLNSLSPSQRERLKHLRAEDLPQLRSMDLVAWPYQEPSHPFFGRS